VAAREAICVEMEALRVPGGADTDSAPPADLATRVRALRAKWQQEIAARGVDPERAQALDRRFADAVAAVLARWPAAFAGSELDPDANRKRLESLVKRIEDLANSVAGPSVTADENLSPTTRLAAMLKEALAANTIGGKAETDNRLRAAAEEVRQAQATWSRVGMVPDDVRRPLLERFQGACRRIMERAPKTQAPPRGFSGSGRSGASGGSGRASGSGGSGR
jgi:hypothetical protein